LTDGNNAALQALVGKRIGPYNSFNPVSAVQIWQWCSALGEHSPLYLDSAYRAGTEFAGKGAVAPPAMMQMWTNRDINFKWAPGSTSDRPYQAIDDLEALGFPGNVAVSYDITFHRYLVEGDRAHHYKTIVSISDLKTTALGEGYFFTDRMEFLDQHGDLFAEALVTYFQYRPAESSPPELHPAVLPESDPRDVDYVDIAPAELAEGDALPTLAIPITHELIVGGAIATQDFVRVHHSVPAAKAAGMPDIFMNILTSCGLSARYLSDWAGPGSRLRKLKLRLMAPNVPGDTMLMQGTISGLDSSADKTSVDVEFSGSNNLGPHVVGSATLLLAGT